MNLYSRLFTVTKSRTYLIYVEKPKFAIQSAG